MSLKNNTRFSPTDFMRARRPELFSDTVYTDDPVISRNQLEFHLDTLTQRKEEIRFEHFCRKLSEKELCPNLLPQTGPTGGGDSKTDAETFPVADSIAERWYVGDPKRAAAERWAFAFSAKKTWHPKVKDDVRKIVETGRGYSLIFFITNQAVSDRNKAAVQDSLSKQWCVDVRILDRSWIIEKIVENRRWEVVFQTLDIDRPNEVRKPIIGPLDLERKFELEELERLIEDQNRYQFSEYQLFEDCLQAALLARGLGHPRVDIDGRFERAERIAQKGGGKRELLRVLYNKAWTANWWFDDFSELDRIYIEAEGLILDSEWVWDLEKLANLWSIQTTWRRLNVQPYDADNWAAHTNKLRTALLSHAMNPSKPTSALWARTQLVLMDLQDAASDAKSLPEVMNNLKGLLKEAEGHSDYPVEPIIKIIEEFGKLVGGDDAYDEIIEAVIEFQAKRVSESEQGRMRLDRGLQKLNAGKFYDAIEQFSKAQNLLAKDEHKRQFIGALVGAALGYEAAGLLWAGRANLLMALDRAFYEFVSIDKITPQALSLIRRLLWIEVQLGRLPCIFEWINWQGLFSGVLILEEEDRRELEEEYQLFDNILGILILRTRYQDWPSLSRIPGILEKFSLLMSRGAAIFSLGHEETLRSEYGQAETDLNEFFSLWLIQPAANDLPIEPEWHLGKTVPMRTVLLGCEIELIADNQTISILLGESILAFLESFLSTTIKLKGHYSARSFLKIEVRQSENEKIPFEHRVTEDDCGETGIVITHPIISPPDIVQNKNFQESLIKLLATIISELQVPFSYESLKGLFASERAQDRAFLVAQSPIALTNILTEKPKYHISDWIDESMTENFDLVRSKPWKENNTSINLGSQKNETLAGFSDESPPTELFGIDGLKHRDVLVYSPINMPLWDKAAWCGLGFSIWKGNPPIPELSILFDNFDAGCKIFKGWIKRIGKIDRDEWIGLIIVTGIDCKNPAHYRLAVSIGENYLTRKVKGQKQFVSVTRMHTMNPENSNNLDQFIRLYKESGRYRLAPGNSVHRSSYSYNLTIEKRQLRIVPAWKIGLNDPACVAIKDNDNPVIPPDVTDPPFLKVLKRRETNKL